MMGHAEAVAVVGEETIFFFFVLRVGFPSLGVVPSIKTHDGSSPKSS